MDDFLTLFLKHKLSDMDRIEVSIIPDKENKIVIYNFLATCVGIRRGVTHTLKTYSAIYTDYIDIHNKMFDNILSEFYGLMGKVE